MTFELAWMPVLSSLMGSIRVFAMMFVGPVFGHPAFGTRHRVLASVLVAWAAAPIATGRLATADWNGASVVSAVFVELAIGLLVGVGAGLVFAAMMLLGEFLAVQGGIGAAQTLDPATGVSSPALGLALQSFALVVFLAIDGHHALLRGIATSFEVVPIGGALPSGEAFLGVARLGSQVFTIAFQIAAPVTVAIFVQNVATGVLGRAMPQLNILIVNLPLHVGIVLLVLALGANDVLHAMKDAIEVWPDTVFGTVLGAAHGG